MTAESSDELNARFDKMKRLMDKAAGISDRQRVWLLWDAGGDLLGVFATSDTATKYCTHHFGAFTNLWTEYEDGEKSLYTAAGELLFAINPEEVRSGP